MSATELPELKPQAGGFALSGPVVHETVSALVNRFSGDTASATIDLKQVTQADSAALTLFLAWKKQAKNSGTTIKFINWPENLLSLVRLYGLESVLADTALSKSDSTFQTAEEA